MRDGGGGGLPDDLLRRDFIVCEILFIIKIYIKII
jgi:hypothetical protein